MAMDVKKKLVELIKDGIRKGLRAKGDDRLDYSFEDVADYLIAHGVTVQSERMVDAVPVVRCKDCKYGEVDDADLPTQYLCNYHGADWNGENHFCSYGERKENE